MSLLWRLQTLPTFTFGKFINNMSKIRRRRGDGGRKVRHLKSDSSLSLKFHRDHPTR